MPRNSSERKFSKFRRGCRRTSVTGDPTRHVIALALASIDFASARAATAKKVASAAFVMAAAGRGPRPMVMPVALLVSGSRAVPQFLVQSRPVQNAGVLGRPLGPPEQVGQPNVQGRRHGPERDQPGIPAAATDSGSITVLTGRGHYTVTGGCPFGSDFNSRIQRTGD